MDEQGELLPIDIPPSQLKLISQDEIMPADDVYEVDFIAAHKKEPHGSYLYKVRWKGYTAEDDTWEPYDHFNSTEVITSYWERLGVDCPHDTNQTTLLNSTSKRKRKHVHQVHNTTRTSKRRRQ
ncbi:hypothetical protein O0I10_012395 [Lichtheimia ornata]|uniref:Chromo domain-containing protein n=1 Tax=Lichtheimia ornata TaxID=688661 RepID=A0AAD7URQ1_9FUNG|nr:uncharacterized protein O0I10_012395 [Lichtheimia ornata]KAJ8652000.1 hypothetical protein O0I10_012395 [Lichtheimia ornata]